MKPSLLTTLITLGVTLCSSAILRADLVAHYGLDELPGSGSTVTDSFAFNHGTIVGADPVTKGVTPADPVLGTATVFSRNSGVNLGSSSTVRPADQFTMTWWMRPDTLDDFDRVYETLSGTGNDGNGIRIDLGSNGNKLRVLIRDGNGVSNTSKTHGLTLKSDGTWYFAALRYDSSEGNGSALKLTVLEHKTNINASDISSATQTANSLNTGSINVHGTGAYLATDNSQATGNNSFGGGLDDFAIFQTGDVFGVLSDADLATVATGGALPFDPPDLPPVINSFTTSSSSISSGASVTLSWDVDHNDTLTITPDIGNVDAQTTNGIGSVLITPSATTVYTLTNSNSSGSTTSKLQVTVDGLSLPPLVTEFVASNGGSHLDGDGNDPDWIEIHNPDLSPLDISGYHLTDDATDLNKWPFPSGTILPGDSYLVVFASGQATDTYVDAGGHLHTNFSLKASGEYLGFIEDDGSTVLSEFAPTYPAQESDVSYSSTGFHLTPTPGGPETSPGVLGFVADTTFDIDRGFYTAPFNVNIDSATLGHEIYFTTDGSEPTPTNGTLHSGPIPISTTTTLRAVATKPGYAPSNIDTQTYLFLDDVLDQPNSLPGYPSSWAGRTADYEMDPDVVDDLDYAADMEAALQAFPTLSLVMDKDDMFGGGGGIYQNPQSEGSDWERPVSAELIIPDASEPGFQLNAGIRIQGGTSRNPDTPKHSMSLRFRSEYGPGKLNYPLFANAPDGENAVDKFDYLHLRSGYNNGWIHRHWFQARHGQYARDQFVSDLFLAMDQPASHGRWVHLYINGIYWGVYQTHERPDSDFMASYFGGEAEDYDAINASEPKEGDLVAWDAMIAIANGNIASAAQYAAIQQYLDVDSLIDYMLVNFYVGNRDWDGHNWRAGRKREPGAGYKFYPWDSEFAVSPNSPGSNPSPDPLSNALSTDVTGRSASNRPSGMHDDLTANTEYVMRFADRAHQHLYNDGPLTPPRVTDTWTLRSDQMDDAVIAESARWGDFKRDVSPGTGPGGDFDLFTKNDHYLPDQAWIVGTYLPQRTAVFIGQLRSRGVYPATDAPVFSQHGGVAPIGYSLSMTNPNGTGTLYYTLDGSDPRDPNAGGNLVSATAIPYSSAPTLNTSLTAKARVLNGSEWSALNSADFLIGPLATAGNLAVSEIMYNPAGPSEDTEFIELVNISPSTTIELGNARFNMGIDFTFPPNTLLGPGDRILVVANTAAFEAIHGNSLNIAGEFTGSLDNDGERLVLLDAADNIILDFTYNDGLDWPADADGNGNSLVLSSPALSTDLDNPFAWRDSTNTNGNPDATDSTSFTGTSTDDNDSDGLSALLEHGVGSSDSNPDPAPGQLLPVLQPDGHLTITLQVNLLADDIVSSLEQSDDFGVWNSATDFDISTFTRNPDGTATITYRSTDPMPGTSRLFLRQRITQP